MVKALDVQAGDVYAARLKDGRYGAVRVLRLIERGPRAGRPACHLACTTYLGDAPPTRGERALREILRRHRFEFGGALATTIVDEPPPASFVCVGNVPVAQTESKLKLEESYGVGWRLVEDVLMEWRFSHERAKYTRAVAAEAKARAKEARSTKAPPRRKRIPRSTLTEKEFWELIELVDATSRDDDAKVAPLIDALARRSAADIREFQELLAHALYRLDARRYAVRGRSAMADDAFLYARCAVVAKGRRHYEQVLRQPARFPRNAELEALLGAAPEAFARRTGRDYDALTHYSYETGSNRAAWK